MEYQLSDDVEYKDKREIETYRQDICEATHSISEDSENHHHG